MICKQIGNPKNGSFCDFFDKNRLETNSDHTLIGEGLVLDQHLLNKNALRHCVLLGTFYFLGLVGVS